MMARKIDYDNLSDEDLVYMSQRNWLITEAEFQGIEGIRDRVSEAAKAALEDDIDDEELDDEEEEEFSYQDAKVEELREELKRRELSTTGNKEELIARLEADDES